MFFEAPPGEEIWFNVLFSCRDLPAFLTRARFSVAVLVVASLKVLSWTDPVHPDTGAKHHKKKKKKQSIELTEVQIQTTLVTVLRDG